MSTEILFRSRTIEDPVLLERVDQGDVYLDEVFDIGTRLVFNRNIDNVNFMIVVALMEIF